MANKPAERNTQATTQYTTKFASILLAHNIELEAQRQRAKPKMPVRNVKPDKMWLYVNGKRQLQVDADKAHALAATYTAQGDSVWLTRKLVSA